MWRSRGSASGSPQHSAENNTTVQLCPITHNAHKVTKKNNDIKHTRVRARQTGACVRACVQAGPSRGGRSLPLPVGEGGRGAAQRLPAVLRSQGAGERQGQGGSPPTGKRRRVLGTAAIVTGGGGERGKKGHERRVNGGERVEPGERWEEWD